jgi:hypothetical protein
MRRSRNWIVFACFLKALQAHAAAPADQFSAALQGTWVFPCVMGTDHENKPVPWDDVVQFTGDRVVFISREYLGSSSCAEGKASHLFKFTGSIAIGGEEIEVSPLARDVQFALYQSYEMASNQKVADVLNAARNERETVSEVFRPGVWIESSAPKPLGNEVLAIDHGRLYFGKADRVGTKPAHLNLEQFGTKSQ